MCMVRGLRYNKLPDRRTWWRVADPTWSDPLSPMYSKKTGGRWNPPESFPTLYLNGDKRTARCNLQLFAGEEPYEPEDLRGDTAPVLIACQLPRNQVVCDVHTNAGLRAADLPDTYPLDPDGDVVEYSVCQEIGEQVRIDGKRGVHARSARSLDPADLELAWFPASSRSIARGVQRLEFSAWYWAR